MIMKKLLTIISVLMMGVCAFTQTEFKGFHLSPNGYFETDEGKDFIVYPFEGKTSHEIYQMICTNVGKTYASPKSVMSNVEDASVAIRAYSDNMVFQKSYLGLKFFYSGYYNLLIEIKDGRVKVNAPVFGEMSGGAKDFGGGVPKDAVDVFKGFFDSKGKVKSKRAVWKTYVESKINEIYETLLGIGSPQKAEEDNW